MDHSACVSEILPKGQLISKCPFGCHCLDEKNNDFFFRISALASKKIITYTNYSKVSIYKTWSFQASRI